MKKQKIITCTGYGGTGSSAITDLLKEFQNVYSYGDTEFRFLQDPNGIRDLEYGIIENNERNITDYRIKHFKKRMKFLNNNLIHSYKKYFGKNFKVYTDMYIKSLIKLQWEGYSPKDILEETLLKKFLYYTERFIQKKIFHLKEGGAKIYKNKTPMSYTYITKTYFYEQTKEYLNKLFLEILKEEKEYLALDQLVPPNNINKYLDYFYDIKVIVVDRDPRDLYLLNEIFWHEAWIPTKNIELYIEWFKLLREHQKIEIPYENKNRILRIKFEDMIFNYDTTLRKILSFLEISEKDHNEKKKFFNPEVSIKNTQLFKKYKEYENEIEIIEEKLKEFCYF